MLVLDGNLINGVQPVFVGRRFFSLKPIIDNHQFGFDKNNGTGKTVQRSFVSLSGFANDNINSGRRLESDNFACRLGTAFGLTLFVDRDIVDRASAPDPAFVVVKTI